MDDRRAGGPTIGEEKCKGCGNLWTRYRGGSWDWKDQDCYECLAKTVSEKFKKDLFDEEMKEVISEEN